MGLCKINSELSVWFDYYSPSQWVCELYLSRLIVPNSSLLLTLGLWEPFEVGVQLACGPDRLEYKSKLAVLRQVQLYQYNYAASLARRQVWCLVHYPHIVQPMHSTHLSRNV